MVEVAQIPPRRPDWRARLATYLADLAGRRFRPGRHDCALFAAGAVEAMTGVDLAAPWRGTYRSLEQGRAALEAAGWASHQEFVAAHFAPVAPSLAQVGDLAVMPGEIEGSAALGVVQGPAVYVLTPAGLGLTSRLHMLEGYRV